MWSRLRNAGGRRTWSALKAIGCCRGRGGVPPMVNCGLRGPFRNSSTSLSKVFDTSSMASSNPRNSSLVPSLFRKSEKTAGLFGLEPLVRPEGFQEMEDDCLRACDELVAEVVSPRRTRLVAKVFDDLSDELCRVADLAEFIRQAHPDPAFRAAAEKACISVSYVVEKLNTNRELYNTLHREACRDDDGIPSSSSSSSSSVTSGPGGQQEMKQVDRHVTKLFLLDFQQCGIHLQDADRESVVRLNDGILQDGQRFANMAQEPTIIRASELPDGLRYYHKPAKGSERDSIAVHSPMAEHVDGRVREAAYKAYNREDPEREDALKELLRKRNEVANICGFPTYGHRATVESLAQNPENVSVFLDHVSQGLAEVVSEDFKAMRTMKRRAPVVHGAPYDPVDGPTAELQVWDLHYYQVQGRTLWSQPVEFSQYLSLGTCMEGISSLFEALFGVTLIPQEAAPGELWHPDVLKLSVRDSKGASGEELGTIYCDFYCRPGKPMQDCHFTIRGGRRTRSGSYQNPVVVVMLNLNKARPSGGVGPADHPTLLSLANLENLMHEMGHAMHSMLGRTEYQHVTGTRCSTDFAEVPSTLMEFFANDPRVLQRIARHYKSGQTLPAGTLANVAAARRMFNSVDAHTQVLYALVDQALHGDHRENGLAGSTTTTTDILERVHGRHHPLAYHKGCAWHLRFSHLVGYGARYYSYLMSRAVASLIWQRDFDADPFNPDAGGRYRRECLAHGGGKPSYRLVSDYLGGGDHLVGPQQLAEALVSEIRARRLGTRHSA